MLIVYLEYFSVVKTFSLVALGECSGRRFRREKKSSGALYLLNYDDLRNKMLHRCLFC